MTHAAPPLGWHRTVVALSTLAPLATITLANGNPIRILLGSLFILLVPGMAVVGRSTLLRRRGLWSLETWSIVIPISFSTFVAGSLASVYLYGWRPTATVWAIGMLCAGSSGSIVWRHRDDKDPA